MGNDVKVLIGEINGQELDQQEEYDLKVRDLSDVNADSAAEGDILTWDVATEKFIISQSPVDTELGKIAQTQFFGQGAVGNKWLSLGASAKTSNNIPYPAVHDVDLMSFSWSNSSSTLDVGIEIYKNGTAPGNLVGTINVLNKKTIADTSIPTLSFTHGDRISIFLRKNGSGNATDPIVTLYFQIKAVTSSEVFT